MIAKESEEVVKMAKKIADACTDKRMKRVRYFITDNLCLTVVYKCSSALNSSIQRLIFPHNSYNTMKTRLSV